MKATSHTSTVARMAGNILGGMVGPFFDQDRTPADEDAMVRFAVRMARKAVLEIARAEAEDALAAELSR